MREGAEFYSDTFAVVGEDGWVDAYRAVPPGEPRPERLRIGLIAVAPYVPGASWAPEQGGPADGALALLAHAATSEDPGGLLKVLGAAAAEALTLRGERGEAADVAPALLELASHLMASTTPAELALEAFGVHVTVSLDDPSLLPLVRAILPPGSREPDGPIPEARFGLTRRSRAWVWR